MEKPWPATSTDVRSAAWSSPGVAEDTKGPKGGGKQVVLVRRPVGDFKPEDFEVRETPVPSELGEGEALVQNVLVSLDPTHRIWASDDRQYMPCVGLNTVMRAGTLGKVVKSSDEAKMPVGSYVSAFGGVQAYCVAPIATLNPAVPDVPLSYNLSLFSSIIGLTAWVGSNICEPTAGKTIVVSGAAGAVGSLAGQVCQNRGARVIGIAGSAEKCAWLTGELGFAGAINYKTEDVAARLRELAPGGIDGYFDNVGGTILEEVLLQMNNLGNIAFCGSISGYNSKDGQTMTITNYQMILFRRIKVQGFVCVDHVADMGKAIGELGGYLKEGKCKFKEDIVEAPLDDYVKTVNKLYDGTNSGKLMMKICAE
uniref:Enoyl reductase (ER) domain-containing protein n=1 Tax=Alexandrium catenella TaxID=2925 RepID=A0A7S1S8K4_ALECA|mmetsp:Transcript_90762/g.241163  ORF Transcript_90762/g.241163 Transcript_90762/m.241163 type:complete len:368 (+) Transcript_90762:69-1172(+)